MDGFFSKKETESITRPGGKTYSCVTCGLYKDCQNPKMKPFGNFKKGILNIGEFPGSIEDRRGKPWQDRDSTRLHKLYQELGIDLIEDCLNIYAVQCHPLDTDGQTREPVNFEIECCRKSVIAIIEKYKPKVIIAFGSTALYSLIGHRWKKDFGQFTKWRGWTIPDQDFQSWICPVYNPNFINNDKDDVAKVIWKQDLERALKKISIPFPKLKEPHIEIIEDLSILSTIPKGTPIVIDFETTGIKPHDFGHQIVCVGIADSPDHCYVFMTPKSRKARQPMIDLFANPDIPKWGQNIKYEEVWSTTIFRQPIINWQWDTMLASHILDNRAGVTGLKFQTYVQFGVIDYSSEIDSYFTSPKGGNEKNKILDILYKPDGQQTLLRYCGYDTIYEYRLALLQKQIIYED